MNKAKIENYLNTTDPDEVDGLFRAADQIRRREVGNQVHLRGLVEISSYCRRSCAYCGLRSANRNIERYRMSGDEVLGCARQAAGLGYGTVVLQAGEDPSLSGEWVSELVRRIIEETGLAVALSLGERTVEELAAWREAGATRYLLRFETSDERLFRELHPPLHDSDSGHPRMHLLREIARLGYETGSGVMVGLPGQSTGMLAGDLLSFEALELDMIGIGPWISHPDTPLASIKPAPGGAELTLRMIALARLLRPRANIPATTALATAGGEKFLELALGCGANVIMPDLTPARYRAGYSIYPGKHGFYQDVESVERQAGLLKEKLGSLGRVPGRGPGCSLCWLARGGGRPLVSIGGVL